jgi:hypothetical protein
VANRYFSSKKNGPKITFELLKVKRKGILEKLNELDFSEEASIGKVISQFEKEGLSALAVNFKNVFSVYATVK